MIVIDVIVFVKNCGENIMENRIHLNGKTTFAKIMIGEIDKTTRDQIQTFIDHPAFRKSKVRIMPDCHAGKGAVIGTTATFKDAIIPNMVGVDIGCGVISMNIGSQDDIDFQALDDHIRKYVPIGYVHHHNVKAQMQWLPGIMPERVQRVENFMKDIHAQLNSDKHYNLSIGTLGGGNHFIEFGRDEDENVWITIHSGQEDLDIMWRHGIKIEPKL